MTLVGLLLLIVVGAICGAIAELIVGFSPGGFLASAVVGFLGAFIGTWIARELHMPGGLAVTVSGYTIDVVWAVLGAILLLLVLGAFRRTTYWRRFHY